MNMGRRPTVNINLPQHMRARVRGDVTYYFYDTGGKPRKEIPLGKDYIQAVQKWAQLQGNAQTPTIDFSQLCNKYIAEVMPLKSARTQLDNATELKNLQAFFCNPSPAPISQIKQLHVRQYLDWRTKNGTQSTARANREKALLSHMFNMAINWGILEGVNPCSGVKGYTEKGRDVYIENDVFNAVYEVASQPLRDAIDLAYLTGQRPSDVVSMSQLDIQDGALVVEQAKTGAKLRISIEGELEALINRIKAQKTKHKVHTLNLICNENGKPLTRKAIEERFKKARLKAIAKHPTLTDQIKQYQFRDLRAKATTDKAESQDMRAAQMLAGHSSVVMTEHYVRNKRGQKVSPTR